MHVDGGTQMLLKILRFLSLDRKLAVRVDDMRLSDFIDV